MDNTKKIRGAWVIRVREIDVRQDADTEHDGCSPTPTEGIPYRSKQKNTTIGRKE